MWRRSGRFVVERFRGLAGVKGVEGGLGLGVFRIWWVIWGV